MITKRRLLGAFSALLATPFVRPAKAAEIAYDTAGNPYPAWKTWLHRPSCSHRFVRAHYMAGGYLETRCCDCAAVLGAAIPHNGTTIRIKLPADFKVRDSISLVSHSSD